MSIFIFPPEQQASGQFDEGKLVEQKPIGFPGEGSAVNRVGTLFYWAWFKAKENAYLPFHPHRGFEIISYLLKGRVHHQDTLGNEKTLNPGELQVMQTGSGVQHSENYEEGTSGFQIWFEPFMGESNYEIPTYADYGEQEFPITTQNGIAVKTILGKNSPVQLVADAKMWDITISSGQKFEHGVPDGYSIAGLVVDGQSIWQFANEMKLVNTEMFAVCESIKDSLLSIEASTNQDTRLILIQVPSVLPYPSYKDVKIRVGVRKDDK